MINEIQDTFVSMKIFGRSKKNNDDEIGFSKSRLLLVTMLIAIIFVLLALRLIYLTVEKGDYYNRLVLSQRQTSYNSQILPSRRGDILDSEGNLLATSIKVYNLIIDPKVINSYRDNRYLNATIDALSDVYEYSRYELRDLIQEKKDKAYLPLSYKYRRATSIKPVPLIDDFPGVFQ